jgi:hypothetical protein
LASDMDLLRLSEFSAVIALGNWPTCGVHRTHVRKQEIQIGNRSDQGLRRAFLFDLKERSISVFAAGRTMTFDTGLTDILVSGWGNEGE